MTHSFYVLIHFLIYQSMSSNGICNRTGIRLNCQNSHKEKAETYVSLRSCRCSKARRPRELSESSNSDPSMMSSLNGRALTINLWLSAPRDSTTPFSSLDSTDKLIQTPAFLMYSATAHMHKADLLVNTYGWVGGSPTNTSGTSKRGFRGLSSFIFTRVMLPCSLYNSNSKWTCHLEQTKV